MKLPALQDGVQLKLYKRTNFQTLIVAIVNTFKVSYWFTIIYLSVFSSF